MVEKFYVDTSIWIDLYEDRKGYCNEPLGDFALKLFSTIKAQRKKLFISDILFRELESFYTLAEVNGMMKPFEDIIEKIISTGDQREEAHSVAQARNVPPGDALHAILARDHGLILISRDNDFKKLQDISPCHKPEEII